MDNLVRLHSIGEIPTEGFGRHYQPWQDQMKQLETTVPQLQGEIDFLKIQSYSAADVVTEAQDLYSHWKDLEPAEKRQIIENITEGIIIGNDEIAINLSYKPTSTELVAKGQRNLRVALLSALASTAFVSNRVAPCVVCHPLCSQS